LEATHEGRLQNVFRGGLGLNPLFQEGQELLTSFRRANRRSARLSKEAQSAADRDRLLGLEELRQAGAFPAVVE
jgi:hypothetical protein